MGDIHSLNLGLAMFHMMKTTYIRHGPEHRTSWKVDLTIYSIGKNAPDSDAGQSTSKMRTRAHIYSDHAAQVNFSSHEYQILKAMDTPEAHENPKPMIFGQHHLSSQIPL
jgi:hypothetical protein